MAVEVGSLFASLTLESAQFTRGMAQAERTTASAMGSIQRQAGLTSRAVEGVSRSFNQPIRPYSLIAASRAFDNTADRANLLRGALIATTGVFGGFTAALTSNVILRYADTYTQLNNQLRVVSDSTADLRAQFSAIEDVATRSRAGLKETAILYSRLAKAAPDIGADKLLRFTETIQKALQLGGATAQEAASAAVQFSQAIASNRLGGEELRAILETPLGGQLAKGLGVTIGQFRELSIQGKLTASVILGALENIGASVDEQFSGSVRTLDQAITLADNRFISYIGSVNETYGVTNILGDAILGLANNLETLGSIAGVVAPVVGSIFAGKLLGGAAGSGFGRITASFAAVKAASRDALDSARSNVEGFTSSLAATNKQLAELKTRIATTPKAEFADRSTVKALARDLHEIQRLDESRLNLNGDIRNSYRQLASVTAQVTPRMISATDAVAKAESRVNELLAKQQQLRTAQKRNDTRQLGAAGMQATAPGTREIAQVRAAAQERIRIEREIIAAQEQAATARANLSQRIVSLSTVEAAAQQKAAEARISALKSINDLTAKAAALDEKRASLQSRITTGVGARDQQAAANILRQQEQLYYQTIRLKEGLAGAQAQFGRASAASGGFAAALGLAARAGSSLVSFLGGPWGIAFTAATLAFAFLGKSAAETAAQIDRAEGIVTRTLGTLAEKSAAAKKSLADIKLEEAIKGAAAEAEDVGAAFEEIADSIRMVAVEADDLRNARGELVPGAQEFTKFLDEALAKLKEGDTDINKFRDSIEAFGRVQNVDSGFISRILAEIPVLERYSQTIGVIDKKLKDLNNTKSTNSRTDIFGTEAESLMRQTEGRAQIDALAFAEKVSEIKSREQKIAENLRAAFTKSGATISAGLEAYIQQVAKAQALVDKLSTAAIAQQQPFQFAKQDPYRKTVPGIGDQGVQDRGNASIQLAQLLEQAKQVRDLREQLTAQKGTIAGAGGLLKELFGDKADSAEVKAALAEIEKKIQEVFTKFSTGKFTPVQAFNEIEKIRQSLVDLGAVGDPLETFLDQVNAAITGVPNLVAQIKTLTTEMQALAKASREVKLPGGSVIKSVPGAKNPLPGFATGGAFGVGGAGGTDSQLVQFMASPNETVAVFTPNQMRAMNDNIRSMSGASINAPITVVANDANSFKGPSGLQVRRDLADMVSSAVNRAR